MGKVIWVLHKKRVVIELLLGVISNWSNENQASLGFHFLHTATSNFHGKKNYQHLNHKGQPKALRWWQLR